MLFDCKIKEENKEIDFLVESKNMDILQDDLKDIVPHIAKAYNLMGGENTILEQRIADLDKVFTSFIFRKKNMAFVEISTDVGLVDLLSGSSIDIVKLATIQKKLIKQRNRKDYVI